MLKALLKKDISAFLVNITTDRRKGTRRSTAGIVLFALLFVFIFISLGAAFFSYALMLSEAVPPGSWLYMSIIGCFGLILGLFGSVFSTYSTIYKAKDNELMLSLPIPQGKLLASKMANVYAMTLLFCTLGMLPGFIYAWIEHAVTPLSVVLSILEIFFMSLLVTALACILAWVVALIVGLFPNKNAATVIFTLGFLALYYIFYFRMMSSLTVLITMLGNIGDGIKGYAYPIYKMGEGAAGDPAAFGIFAGISVLVFLVIYFVLSRNFTKILTKSEKQRTKVYVEKTVKAAGAPAALLRKEFGHLLGSAAYMLNCALGSVLMVLAAVFILIKASTLRELIGMLQVSGLDIILKCLPLVAGFLICFISTMNDLTAPSISLEGKTLWLLKSLPIETSQIFWSKQRLHLILTVVPALILHAAVCIVMQLSLKESLEAGALVLVFIFFYSAVGLFINLKLPNLNWTNETIAVKQSGSVMISIFGSWVVLIAIGVLYALLLIEYISPEAFLLALTAFFLVLTVILNIWLKNRGRKIFEAL